MLHDASCSNSFIIHSDIAYTITVSVISPSDDATSGRVDGSAFSQDGRQLSSIRCLQAAVGDLLGIISTTSAEKDSLVTERTRVCHLLNIDQPVACMDVVVKDAVDKASEDLATNVRELALHDKMARSLESRVKSVKGDAERHLAVLQKQVGRLNRRNTSVYIHGNKTISLKVNRLIP